MRQDQTRWTCSRCNQGEIVDLGKNPSTSWWELTISTVRERFSTHERTLHLCSTCANALDKWMRDKDAQVVGPKDPIGIIAAPDETGPPPNFCTGSRRFYGHTLGHQMSAECPVCKTEQPVTGGGEFVTHRLPEAQSDEPAVVQVDPGWITNDV